jgi:hypothetical protein
MYLFEEIAKRARFSSASVETNGKSTAKMIANFVSQFFSAA